MKVHMKDDERQLFEAGLRRARSYAEFGCGGSTVLAYSIVEGPVFSVDSSREWTDRVVAACRELDCRTMPQMCVADIGTTGDWGVPIDRAAEDRWPLYALSMWKFPEASDSDLFLIDGRFRVSCFMETLLRCKNDAVLMIHDFAERAEYHGVLDFVDVVETASSLMVGRRKVGMDWRKAIMLIDEKRFSYG